MKAVVLPALALLISLASIPCLAQGPRVELVRVKNPGFPHSDKSLNPATASTMKLTSVGQTLDDTYDGQGWTSQNQLYVPKAMAGPASQAALLVTEYGTLKFFRPLPDGFHLAIYESTSPLGKGLLNKSDAQIYDKDYSYVALVLDGANKVTKAYDLNEFFPLILEMFTAEVVGNVLYFDATYNGYANITKNKTGYMVAIDVLKGHALWTSPALTTSYGGFVVVNDHIVTGYGFTAEPDFLYLLNRHTGEVVQKEKLKTGPDRFAVKGNRVYVNCYDINYVFEF